MKKIEFQIYSEIFCDTVNFVRKSLKSVSKVKSKPFNGVKDRFIYTTSWSRYWIEPTKSILELRILVLWGVVLTFFFLQNYFSCKTFDSCLTIIQDCYYWVEEKLMLELAFQHIIFYWIMLNCGIGIFWYEKTYGNFSSRLEDR